MQALDLDGMLRRLHLPTVRRLYPECEQRAEAEDQSYRDFLATLIAEEVAHRTQTRIERSLRKARFPVPAHHRGLRLHLPDLGAPAAARELSRPASRRELSWPIIQDMAE